MGVCGGMLRRSPENASQPPADAPTAATRKCGPVASESADTADDATSLAFAGPAASFPCGSGTRFRGDGEASFAEVIRLAADLGSAFGCGSASDDRFF